MARSGLCYRSGAAQHQYSYAYDWAGNRIADGNRMAGLRDADIMLRLRTPPIDEVAHLRDGCVHISFLY